MTWTHLQTLNEEVTDVVSGAFPAQEGPDEQCLWVCAPSGVWHTSQIAQVPLELLHIPESLVQDRGLLPPSKDDGRLREYLVGLKAQQGGWDAAARHVEAAYLRTLVAPGGAQSQPNGGPGGFSAQALLEAVDKFATGVAVEGEATGKRCGGVAGGRRRIRNRKGDEW